MIDQLYDYSTDASDRAVDMKHVRWGRCPNTDVPAISNA